MRFRPATAPPAFALLFALFALSACPLFALNPRIPVTDYQRRNWTTQDGYALGEVIALAQTPDGFLWLGTSRGLRRFDGVNFTRWNWQPGGPLDEVRITALTVSRDGALWVGTVSGLSRLAHGQLKTFTAADGLPHGAVVSLLEDASGVMWAGAAGPDGGGLAALDGHTIKAWRHTDGLPGLNVYSLFEDRSHTLWVGSTGACAWSPQVSAAPLCPVPSTTEVGAIASDSTGALIFGDTSAKGLVIARVANGQILSTERKPLGASPTKQFLDRDGNLWISTAGKGLLRLHDGKVESLTTSDNLLSNVVDSVLEDRDGDLWMGTLRGLTRLRNPVAAHLTVPGNNLPLSVLATSDGKVWIGATNAGLLSLPSIASAAFSKPAIENQTILSLHEFQGAVWAGAVRGLMTINANRPDPVRANNGAPLGVICSMTDNGQGTLWLLNSQGRVFKTNGGAPEPLPYWTGAHIRSIYATHNGDLWAGFSDGTLQTLRSFGSPAPVPTANWHPGVIYDIAEDNEHAIWIAAREGLGRFRNNRWTIWRTAEAIPPGGIFSLLPDASGLWALTAARLIHIPAASLRATPDGAPQALPVTGYGSDEGLELRDTAGLVSPAMALTNDGQLVLPTNAGLAILDAHRITADAGQPTVLIDQFLVDGQPFALSPKPEVRGREFQFYFTSPNITAGDATRMYYHLDGVDSDWIESRGDRRAIYGLLRPGDYRFHVKVAGIDEGASLVFHINALFYETRYFPVAVLLLLAAIAWGLYLLRMKQVRAGMSLVFQERLRVTRELHDSLLQGFTAVVFQLDTAAREFDRAPESSRSRLNKALEQADSSMKEARHSITLMRLPALETQTLSQALAEIGKQTVEGMGPRFSLEIDPKADTLPYAVQANLYFIARELIRNAATHARASRIDLGLTCDEKSFCLQVHDDGVGFDPENAKPQPGHIGLSAVRERAALIGAVFAIRGGVSKGSVCEVTGRFTKAR